MAGLARPVMTIMTVVPTAAAARMGLNQSSQANGAIRYSAIRGGTVQQLRKVLDHDVGAVLLECIGLSRPVHADDVAELAGAAGFDAGERVLENDRLGRLDPESFGAEQERVRRRLALEVLLLERVAVDPLLDELGQAGHLEYLLGVGARRHHRAPQTGVPGGFEIAARVGRNRSVGRHAPESSRFSPWAA